MRRVREMTIDAAQFSLSLFFGVGARSVVELWCAFSVPLSRSHTAREREKKNRKREREKKKELLQHGTFQIDCLLLLLTFLVVFSVGILYVCASLQLFCLVKLFFSLFPTASGRANRRHLTLYRSYPRLPIVCACMYAPNWWIRILRRQRLKSVLKSVNSSTTILVSVKGIAAWISSFFFCVCLAEGILSRSRGEEELISSSSFFFLSF